MTLPDPLVESAMSTARAPLTVYGKSTSGNCYKVRLLLDQLADIPDTDRGAHFTATLALVAPGGDPTVVQGVWPGRIAREARGENGHGYDPIFVPDGGDATAAELSAEQKNADSHRARALAAIVPALRELG